MTTTLFGITPIQFFQLVFFIVVVAAIFWSIVKIAVPRFMIGMARMQKNLLSQTLNLAQQSLPPPQTPPDKPTS